MMISSACALQSSARNLLKTSRFALSMSSVSDWTEKRAIFQDSDRPQIGVSASSSYNFNGDLLVVPFYKPKEKGNKEVSLSLKSKIPSGLSSSIKKIIEEIIDESDFKGDTSSKQMVKVVGDPSVKYICLVGLGTDPKSDKIGSGDMEITSANRIGKAVGQVVKESKITSVGIAVPNIANAGITQMILGLYESAYTDNRYKAP